jgi:hypothetical protein
MMQPIQICRGFSDEQWNGLRKRLDDGDESAWSCAIDVFERRIKERFVACIEALVTADSKLPGEVPSGAPPDCSTLPNDGGEQVVVPGFAILALCCLLAETLQGFRESAPKKLATTEKCNFPDGPCVKPTTTDQFKEFLRRPAFRGAFDDQKIATSFVKGVRNGILHEAETRGWLIRRDEPRGHMLAAEGKRYALNRTEFFQAVKDEFNSYLKEVRNPASLLRPLFVKRMTDIVKKC